MSKCLTIIFSFIFQNYKIILLLLIQILLRFIQAKIILLNEMLAFQKKLIKVFSQKLPRVKSSPIFLNKYGHLIQIVLILSIWILFGLERGLGIEGTRFDFLQILFIRTELVGQFLQVYSLFQLHPYNLVDLFFIHLFQDLVSYQVHIIRVY